MAQVKQSLINRLNNSSANVLGYMVENGDKETLFAVNALGYLSTTGEIDRTDEFAGHYFKSCNELPDGAEFIGYYNI